MKIFLITILFLLSSSLLMPQSLTERYSQYGQVILTKLYSAPFPHPKRSDGHKYGDKFFPADKHYSDSSVAMFIPNGFEKSTQTDFVIHFHGWYNNIDSTSAQFKLIEQFVESQKNAILVLPEGPKNSADSFGGKLEGKDGFKKFIYEIVDTLFSRGVISTKQIGNIVLSGHSGGYHVISFILMRGGLADNIKEVFLFDALYGQTEKFVYWLTNYKGKLINIYTENGGTKSESEALMEDLDGWGIPYFSSNEELATFDDLKSNKLIFLFTKLDHNECQYVNDNFKNYLSASKSLKDISKFTR